MTPTDQPESGPRVWTLYGAYIMLPGYNDVYKETNGEQPHIHRVIADAWDLKIGEKVRVVEYSALDHMANCFAAEQDKRLKAEARTAELKQNWEREHQERYRDSIAQRMRLCDKLIAAEVRAKELEHDIDGTNGWRDSCAFFEKRAEADERERDVAVLLASQLGENMRNLEHSLVLAKKQRDKFECDTLRLRAALERTIKCLETIVTGNSDTFANYMVYAQSELNIARRVLK